MNTGTDIKIIKIKPEQYKGKQSLITILATTMSQIRAADMAVQNVRVNEDDNTIEVIAQTIRNYEINAHPGIVMPAPMIQQLSIQRDQAKMRDYYNRVQNTKFNAVKRNYKGRNR